MTKLVIKTVVLGAIMAVSSIDAAGAAGKSAHMKLGNYYTSQPIGHYEFCKRFRSDCQIFSKDDTPIEMSRTLWKDLVEINTFSNNKIAPMTDIEAFNQQEVWLYPTSVVLMKRQMLMDRGWPASSLLITVVKQRDGEAHAVLTVRTDRADYVLDNMTDIIKPWNQTPYTYLKRQSSRHSGKWVDIADAN